MLATQLERTIHTLSRQEKYHLIQMLVCDLEREEIPEETEYLNYQNTSRTQAIDRFLQKWKSSLKNVDIDTAKLQYLQEKYQ